MTGRKPRKDELELWTQVTKTVQRTAPVFSMPEDIPPAQAKPRPQPQPLPEFPAVPVGRGTSSKHDLSPSLATQLRSEPVRMDKKAFTRLRQGKLTPEARIDLHGMTLDRAHSVLTRFVLSSHSKGHRLLLVITGKGKHRDEGGPIPVRTGVLRHQVPEWLRIPPLSSAVLQVTPAHRSHGGGGAYYVYLRRRR